MIHPAVHIKNSWRLYFKNFKILLLLVLPTAVFTVILQSFSFFVSNPLHGLLPENGATATLIIWIAGILLAMGVFVSFNAATFGVKKIVAREGADIKESLNVSWSKFLSLLWVTILWSLIYMGGLVLFIIPGVIWGMRYSMAGFAVLFEGKRGMAALRRSAEMTKGRLFDYLISFVCFALVVALIVYVARVVANSIVILLGLAVTSWLPPNAFGDFVMNSVIFIFALAYSTIVMPLPQLLGVLIYNELSGTKAPAAAEPDAALATE